MEPIEILAQALGIGGMVINIMSMQCRRTRGVFSVLLIGAFFFTASYVLLGSFASAVLNVFSIVRSLVLLVDKRDKHPAQLVIMASTLAVCAGVGLYLDGPVALLPIVAQIGMTYGMWLRNGAKLRLVQIAVSSPLWLVNNIIVFSIGGILCEVFVITSVLVSIARYGWKNLKESG